MIGQQISRYRIIEKLGEGGMGEVYLAEDSELDRKVALKFLPPHFSNDVEINTRFKREAKAVAALNHPNIITIYDIGEHEGKPFIAMEYLPGKSLKDLLDTEELSINKIIDITAQICAGLQEAHQMGIFHRDIKPDNILIDAKGNVKIADFGLAKAHGLTKVTQTGSTLGTLDYMSPEQLSGGEVDQRSDIWSLGVVLYRMITGRQPFEGEYDATVSYSIMNETPEPLARYKSDVPDGLQRIVDKVLDKDTETRYQNISDLLTDFKREKKTKSHPVKLVKLQRTTKSKRGMLLTVSIIFLVIVATYFDFQLSDSQPRKSKIIRYNQLTFNGDVSLDPSQQKDISAISPDGQFIAYVRPLSGRKSILVQDLAGGNPLEIFSANDRSEIGSILWFPDGAKILVPVFNWKDDNTFDNITYIIPRLGGPTQKFPEGAILTLSPDGSRYANTGSGIKFINLTNVITGTVDTFSISGDFTWITDMDWSPLDEWILLLTTDENSAESTFWLIKADGTHQQRLHHQKDYIYAAHWASNGEVIYFLQKNGRTRDLMKMKVSISEKSVTNIPEVLQTGLEAFGFSLSKNNNILCYTKYVSNSNLWLITLKDGPLSLITNKLTNGTSDLTWSRISPDDKKVIFTDRGNINVMPITGGEIEQLTFFKNEASSPDWAPDGREIAFIYEKRVYHISAEGGTPVPFNKSVAGSELTWDHTKNILYQQADNQNLKILDPDTEIEKPLVQKKTTSWIFFPRVSPDDKKVAVYWNKKSDRGLWVISLEDTSKFYLNKGYIRPLKWSTDGKWIYACRFDRNPFEILKIPADGGNPKDLVTFPFEDILLEGIDITPDGNRIICAVKETKSDVWVMENFNPAAE